MKQIPPEEEWGYSARFDVLTKVLIYTIIRLNPRQELKIMTAFRALAKNYVKGAFLKRKGDVTKVIQEVAKELAAQEKDAQKAKAIRRVAKEYVAKLEGNIDDTTTLTKS